MGSCILAVASRWRALGAVATAPLLAALLAACGSSSAPSASSRAEVKQTCRQVEAALSDGPDPEADPVGYAQAQILPLRQIRTSDGMLRQAIDMLASAYAAFSSSHGASHAKRAVTSASKAINVICPGVAA
jgi:hypothetical protein